MFPRLLILATACFALCARTCLADEGTDFFEKKVRPLLAERCFECHSPEKKIKGGLRLDNKEGWEKGGDTGPAIAPGDVEKSLLVEAIRYGNRDLQMPPKKQLPPDERAVFEKWVSMGAPDPRTGGSMVTKKQTGLSLEEGRKFWCYRAPRPPAVPAVKDSAWPITGIDRVALAGLEAAAINPASDATPETLARRLYYNLSGLPPTPEQINAFVKAAASDRKLAIEHLVDELLTSQRFGETWGRHWLDVARFAESSGGGRTLLFKDAWRFRDYVIESLNADVPFDRFIREQLAGDLLPAATTAEARRQLTATAFLVLGPTNYEEQEKQQLRFDVIDEQIETVGRAFLGQTIGCARCHDHKFDPIPQRDYYGLAGIFASTRTLLSYTDNVTRWIAAPLPAEGPREAELRAHEKKIAAMTKDVGTAKAELAQASKGLAQETTQPGMPIAAAALPGIVVDDTEAKVVGDWKKSKSIKTYIGEGYLHDANSGKGEKTVTFTPVFPKAGRYEVRLAYAHAPDRAQNVKVTVFHADGEENVFVDQSAVPPIDGRFVSLGKFRFEKDGAGYVLITNEGTNRVVTVDALQFLSEEDVAAVSAKEDTGQAAETKAMRIRLKTLEADLKKAEKSGPSRETAMAVHDDSQTADTQIRVRGIEKQRGETAPRGFLRVALTSQPAIPEGESGRLELANWIASAQNPLTARVFVNHVWNWLFGAGIVRTVDNFGTTGEKPSNPELLDYLATQFTKDGWSTKRLIREIVLSRVWQLSVAAPNPADPENRLFAHANRRRLDAEQIRDTLLAVSGQLQLDYLGPNIAGAGDIDPNTTAAQTIEYGYVFKDARRSVYTPAFRNKRLELFETFDFGDINSPMGQRNVSTVAPQALFFLNHPFVVEQARAAAERTLALPENERLVSAFRRTLGRPPSRVELEKCHAFLESKPSVSLEDWAEIHQALFGCLDFRYLE